MIVDTHAHLTHQKVLPHLDGILKRAQAASLSNIINICTDLESLKEGLALHDRVPWVLNAAATTPHDVEVAGERDFEGIAQAARSGKLIAIGETGLDYYYEHAPRDVQQHFLLRYLQLASECSLPAIFHCRNAFSDLYRLASIPRAVLHCFTGTLEEALQGVERGWFISFSGILTFKKSAELRAVASKLPLSHLLVETDTPYLAPQSRRGEPINEPSFITETVRCLAELKKSSFEEIAQITSENFLQFLLPS